MASSFNTTALPKGSSCLYDLSLNDYIYANNIAVAALHVPFAVFAMASNAVVMLTVITSNNLSSPPNVLLSSLAFGDFLVGAVAQPLLIVLHLQHNAGVGCSVYSATFTTYTWVLPLLVCGSFVQVCVMCWDRYKAVSSPMNYRTKVTVRKTVKIVAASWIGWFAFIFVLKVIPSPLQGILATTALASFIIVCVVSQTAAFKAILRHNNQIGAAATTDMLKREKKMLVTVRCILGSVVLSTLPQLLFSVSYVALGTHQNRVQAYTSPWTKFAMCASSSLNPVIYFWRHENTRKAALRLIGC